MLREQPESWKAATDEYAFVDTFEQLKESVGGHVRYAFKRFENGIEAGGIVFRLGGIVLKVDPEARFVMLKNPNMNAIWSVQLVEHKDGTPVVQVWDSDDVTRYKKEIKRGTYDEMVLWAKPKVRKDTEQEAMRAILRQLREGNIKITKRP